MKLLSTRQRESGFLEEWLNCPHCRTRYKAFLSHCPSCGKTNRYHRQEISGRKSGRKVAIIGVSAAAVVVVLAVIFIIPISQILDFLPLNDIYVQIPLAVSEEEQEQDEPRTELPPASPPSNPISPIVQPSPPEIDYDELAMRVHELINVAREDHGLPELGWDSKLANVAEMHSTDMAEREFFDHVNPDGEDPSARADRSGYECFKVQGAYFTFGIGENIMQGWLYGSVSYVGLATIYNWSSLEEIAQLTVDGWMDSEGHRENILRESYDKEGIGIASTSDYKLYVTENFC